MYCGMLLGKIEFWFVAPKFSPLFCKWFHTIGLGNLFIQFLPYLIKCIIEYPTICQIQLPSLSGRNKERKSQQIRTSTKIKLKVDSLLLNARINTFDCRVALSLLDPRCLNLNPDSGNCIWSCSNSGAFGVEIEFRYSLIWMNVLSSS